MITQSRLKALISYDPETGSMRWLSTRARRIAGHEVGNLHSHGYRETSIDGERCYVHRLVWIYVHGSEPDGHIDHINGNKLDNRLSNLRIVSCQQNSANMKIRPNNKSGFKGVVAMNGRYAAYIHVNRQTRYLGMHDTPEEAHAAYLQAAKEAFGEYARSK